MKYSKTKPTEPGWYWCRAIVPDTPNGVGPWEAVVRIDRFEDSLACSWLSNPGEALISIDHEWSDDCEWSEKLTPPTDG